MTFFTKKVVHSLFAILFLYSSVLVAQPTPFYTETFAQPSAWTGVEVVGDGTPSANWVHTMTGPAGGFNIGTLMSTSPADGWMIFDSDLNCSGEQDAWLVSPKLDLNDKAEVILTFEQLYGRFNDRIYMEVSTDSMTWEEIELFPDLANNEYGDGSPISSTTPTNPQVVTVNLTQYAANQPEFWFAFRFLADQSTVQAGTDVGCGYSWQVDNINLYDEDTTPSVDLGLGDFFYPPRSFAQPVTQIDFDTMAFSADISNLGTDPITNVVLKARVLNGAGGMIWEDSLLIPEVPVGTTDSTFGTPNLYVPEGLAVGNYQIEYETYSLDGDDGDMSNNSASEDFLVTGDLYSKENQATIGFRLNDLGEWAPANLYEISPNIVDCFMATDVTWFTFKGQGTGPLTDHNVNITLFEVDDSQVDAGWNSFDPDAADFFVHPQMNIRALTPYTYTTTATSLTETIMLEDFDLETPGVELNAGGRYVLAAHYPQLDAELFHGFAQEINYFQLSTFVWTAGDAQWFLGGFGADAAATLRMRIQLCNEVDVEEATLPEGSLTVFPNPVSDQLTVDVDLETAGIANIIIADVTGTLIQLHEYENLQKGQFSFNVSDLPNGTYLVRLATEEGTKTLKFIVLH